MRLKAFLFGEAGVEGGAANGGLALLRIFSGVALALQHGLGKIPPSERFVEGVRTMGFPLAEGFAWGAGVSEFFGGFLLAMGLFTRPAAVCIACTMGVAAFIRHAPDPFGRKELAMLYLCVAILFLAMGAGKYGLDALFRRRKQE